MDYNHSIEGNYDAQAVTLEDQHQKMLTEDTKDLYACDVRCSFKVYQDFHDHDCPMAGELDYYAARDNESRMAVALGK